MEAELVAYNKNGIQDIYVLDFSFEDIVRSYDRYFNGPVTRNMRFEITPLLFQNLFQLKCRNEMDMDKYNKERKKIVCSNILRKYYNADKEINIDELLEEYKKELQKVKFISRSTIDDYNLYTECHFLCDLLNFKLKHKDCDVVAIPIYKDFD